MKVSKAFFTPAFLSFIFLSLFVLGIPIAGFADNSPHSCPGGVHLPSSIGVGGAAVQQFDFNFAKICPPNTSVAIKWKWFIYDGDLNLLCSDGPYSIGQTPRPFICGNGNGGDPNPLTAASNPNIKVVINWWTVPTGGAMMTHNDYTSNP